MANQWRKTEYVFRTGTGDLSITLTYFISSNPMKVSGQIVLYLRQFLKEIYMLMLGYNVCETIWEQFGRVNSINCRILSIWSLDLECCFSYFICAGRNSSYGVPVYNTLPFKAEVSVDHVKPPLPLQINEGDDPWL